MPLVRKSIVGDKLADLVAEIRFSAAQADILIITGGLGPTEDDLTREALAEAFGLAMDVEQSIIDRLAGAVRRARLEDARGQQAAGECLHAARPR